MLVIGITGGIGSGKSSVSEFIKEAGFKVISTDVKAKEIMADNSKVKNQIIQHFGSNSYTEEGNLNNAFLAEKVFGSSEEHHNNLAKLNSIVHPPVIDYLINEVKKYEEAGEKILFVESALIFEAELEEGFDYIITVYAPKELCVERLAKRTGLTTKQAELRMNEQICPEEKKSLADFVIENTGTIDKLKTSTEFVIEICKSLTI